MLQICTQFFKLYSEILGESNIIKMYQKYKNMVALYLFVNKFAHFITYETKCLYC
jgi:hypothetical protein